MCLAVPHPDQTNCSNLFKSQRVSTELFRGDKFDKNSQLLRFDTFLIVSFLPSHVSLSGNMRVRLSYSGINEIQKMATPDFMLSFLSVILVFIVALDTQPGLALCGFWGRGFNPFRSVLSKKRYASILIV